jgi:hypothetical protein
MGTYATLADVKKIMRASSRERIRFSEDAFRSLDVGLLENSATNPYNQSKFPKPQYDLIFRKEEVIVDPSYKYKTLINFVFTSPTAYDVYYQSFVDNSYDKREMKHGSGTISTTYDYDGLLSFPDDCWSGTIVQGASVKITFESDISTEDAEFFILNAEIAIDNMLSAAAVDYLEVGQQRLFLAPDIPPQITMAAQYMSAYYIYTNAFAEQSADGQSGHFTDRWKKMAMDMLRDFAIHKNRLPPHVTTRVNFNNNWERRVKEYFDTPILNCREVFVGAYENHEVCHGINCNSNCSCLEKI